jgi:hypothetical protein
MRSLLNKPLHLTAFGFGWAAALIFTPTAELSHSQAITLRHQGACR